MKSPLREEACWVPIKRSGLELEGDRAGVDGHENKSSHYFPCWSLLLMVGKYMLMLPIFIVHCKARVSIEVGIASAFKWHSQRVAASCLFPLPESLTCPLEE